MTELGNRLKEKRTEKKLSLDELQKITKIQKRYLQAIEEGNYDILPGKFYARAFVKQYAEAVDLDPDMIFEEYADDIPKMNTGNYPERISRSQQNSAVVFSKSSAIFAFLPKLLVLILIIGIAVAIYMFFIFVQNGSDGENQVEDPVDTSIESEMAPNQQQNNDATDEEKTNEEENEPIVNENGDSPGNTEEVPNDSQRLMKIGEKGTKNSPYIAYKLLDADTFKVKIAVVENGRSYVGIKNGKGNAFLAEELRDEEGYKKSVEFDFTSEAEMEFNIGNTQGVEFTINEETFTFPYDTAHQRINILFSKENE